MKNGRVFYKMIHNHPTTYKDNRIIKKLRKKCSKIELVVIKQSKTDAKLGNSQPCCVCSMMMKVLNFKNVHYTDKNGNIISEKVIDLKSTHISQMTRSFSYIR